MEPCNSEFVECLSEEGITSNRGQEIKSLSKGCVVKFFLERGKEMSVERYFNRQHGFRPKCQHEQCSPVAIFSVVRMDHRTSCNSLTHFPLASSNLFYKSCRMTLFAASAWPFV